MPICPRLLFIATAALVQICVCDLNVAYRSSWLKADFREFAVWTNHAPLTPKAIARIGVLCRYTRFFLPRANPHSARRTIACHFLRFVVH